MAEDQPLIQARDMGIYRSNRWLVRHVDVQVQRGQLVYVIGANGAGKSTTAKAVLGLIPFDEGEIERSPNLKVGYVPQRLHINPTLPLSIRRLLCLTKRYPTSEIDWALNAVGLQRLSNPPVSTLSGGEFQRLLLAHALLSNPDLLLLDEPAQGVDAAGAEKLYNVIDGIRNELGCGVLYISHDLQLAMDTGDDYLVLVPHEYDDVD